MATSISILHPYSDRLRSKLAFCVQMIINSHARTIHVINSKVGSKVQIPFGKRFTLWLWFSSLYLCFDGNNDTNIDTITIFNRKSSLRTSIKDRLLGTWLWVFTINPHTKPVNCSLYYYCALIYIQRDLMWPDRWLGDDVTWSYKEDQSQHYCNSSHTF